MSPAPLVSFDAVAGRLKAARRAAIFTHVRPDPDALGSQAAAAILLQRLGASVSIIHYAPVPPLYQFLQQNLPGVSLVNYTPEWVAANEASLDTLLIVDTASFQQIEPAADLIRRQHARTVAIDHHLTRDNVGQTIYADTSAAACVEILADLADPLGVTMDAVLGLPLMAGLVADTGWFRFDNVTPRTYRLAARLMEAGVDANALYERLMQNETPPKLALIERALHSLTWADQNRFACMSVTRQDFAETGAIQSQTEAIIDLPLQVGSVLVAAMMTEMPDGVVRVSLRSKHDDVDVSAICRRFGGGGHARASGCRLPGPLEQAKKILTAAVIEAIPASAT